MILVSNRITLKQGDEFQGKTYVDGHGHAWACADLLRVLGVPGTPRSVYLVLATSWFNEAECVYVHNSGRHMSVDGVLLTIKLKNLLAVNGYNVPMRNRMAGHPLWVRVDLSSTRNKTADVPNKSGKLVASLVNKLFIGV